MFLYFPVKAEAQTKSEGQKEDEIQIFSDKFAKVSATFRDRSDNIWIAGIFEIVRIGPEDVTRYENILLGSIEDITEDAAGNIWVASMNKLAKFNGTVWTEVKSPVKESITAILGDHTGNIWLTTSETLSKYDGKKWLKIKIEKESKYDFKLFSEMAFDSHGNLWIAPSVFSSIYKYNGNKLTEIPWDHKEESTKFTKFLYITPNDQLFVGTSTTTTSGVDGLYRFTGKEFKSYLEYEMVYSMHRSDNANYYITTNKGVYENFNLISESHNNDLVIPGKNKIWFIGINSNLMTSIIRP